MFKNIIKTIFRQLGVGGIQLLVIVIVARYSGVESTGEFNLIISLPLIITSFLSLGINSSNVYYISSKIFSAKDVFFSSSAFYVLVSLFMLLGYFVLTYFFPQLIMFTGDEQLYLLLSIVLLLFNNNNLSIIQAKEQFSLMNAILLVQPLFFLMFISAILITSNFKVQFIIYAYLISVSLTFLFSFYLVISNVGFVTLSSKKVLRILKVIVPYGLKSYVTNLCAVLNYRADMYILAFISGVNAVGIYTIAIQVTERLTILSQAISLVLFPRLSLMSEGKTTVLCKIFRLSLIIQLIISFAFILILQSLIVFVFGVEFKDAVLTGIILVPGMLFISLNRVLANYFASEGKPMVNFKCSLISLIVNVFFNYILIQKYSYLGAAIATSISYFVNVSLTSYYFLKSESSISYKDLIIIHKKDFMWRN